LRGPVGRQTDRRQRAPLDQADPGNGDNAERGERREEERSESAEADRIFAGIDQMRMLQDDGEKSDADEDERKTDQGNQDAPGPPASLLARGKRSV
jgi:hypothetical protein